MGKIKPGQFLEYEDVMRLLRSEIERAGGQVAWAEMMGVSRPNLNKHLRGRYPQLNSKIIKALNLRVVHAPIARRAESQKTPTTILGMGKIKSGQFLEYEDVMRLLRSEIERAGNQTAWAKMVGVDRPELNKALGWNRPLSKSVIKALKLRMVYAPDPEAAEKRPQEKGGATKPRNSARKRARPTGGGEAS
jgi:DNA-binding phage protein